MPKKNTHETEQTITLKTVEIKKRNQQITPEFADMFIDVIYRMIIEMLEEEEKESL